MVHFVRGAIVIVNEQQKKTAVSFLVQSHFAIVSVIFVVVHGIPCLCVKVAGNWSLAVAMGVVIIWWCKSILTCSADTKVIFDALDILYGVIAWEVAEYKTKLINNTLRGSLMSQQTVNKGMLRDIWCDLRIACDCTSSCRTK